MVEQLKDDLLHHRTRHTNLMVPYSDYVKGDKFPIQDLNLLDTYVDIRFRNMYKVELPEEYLSKQEKLDPRDIYTAHCRVLRCDSTEPYRMICISDTYEFIFVTDSRYWQETVVQYPIQFNEFIGIKVFDQYVGEIPEIKGVTLRVDNGEPCYSVIIEFLADNQVRFVIGDECFSKLYDYYGEDNDYDGRDSVDYPEPFKDLDGGHVPKITSITQFIIVDGGSADLLKNIYNEAKTTEEIIEMRKQILEGKVLYANS